MNTKQKKDTKAPKEKSEQKARPTQKKHNKPPKEKSEQKAKPTQQPKHIKHRMIKAATEPTDKPKLVDSIVVFI
jgi:hypothetical protein